MNFNEARFISAMNHWENMEVPCIKREKYVVGNADDQFGDAYEEIFPSLMEAEIYAMDLKCELFEEFGDIYTSNQGDLEDLDRALEAAIYIRRYEND